MVEVLPSVCEALGSISITAKKKKKKKRESWGCGHGSSGRAPAQQDRGSEFKPHYQKEKRKKDKT
jgi:hypothetical protein